MGSMAGGVAVAVDEWELEHTGGAALHSQVVEAGQDQLHIVGQGDHGQGGQVTRLRSGVRGAEVVHYTEVVGLQDVVRVDHVQDVQETVSSGQCQVCYTALLHDPLLVQAVSSASWLPELHHHHGKDAVVWTQPHLLLHQHAGRSLSSSLGQCLHVEMVKRRHTLVSRGHTALHCDHLPGGGHWVQEPPLQEVQEPPRQEVQVAALQEVRVAALQELQGLGLQEVEAHAQGVQELQAVLLQPATFSLLYL